jgi:phenylpropionate dioxygenase-like ring-hydroxylating dioxygenase large terminal subunit
VADAVAEESTAARATLLRNIWYHALPSAALAAGKTRAKVIAGEPVVFARTPDGRAFALRDICPHRGITLSSGKFDGETHQCRYHGWRFNGEGVCTLIPSLVRGQELDISKIRVRSYPLHEAQGQLWIFIGDRPGQEPPADASLPRLPGFCDRGPNLVDSMVFPVSIDHAVIGLMDPAHGPFVHENWYWRRPSSMHDKAKAFGPAPLGFCMRRHAPSKNAFAYKFLGGKPETEISFRLPGVRIEVVETGRHGLVNFTAVTPITETETEITHCMYWTLPLPPPIPWLIKRGFVRPFIIQDRDAVVEQRKGLSYDPRLMLIPDADTMARWYFQLKAEWQASQGQGRAFVNPVPETVLRWRS